MKRSGRVANQNVRTCYDKYLVQMAERKDLCRNCCNYLDLPFKKKLQCKMGVREFALLASYPLNLLVVIHWLQKRKENQMSCI